jgi:hypothetical protein
MAESNSPAFTPPMNRVTDEDPSIVRIPMDKVDIGFRKSQQNGLMNDNPFNVKNLKNGQ